MSVAAIGPKFTVESDNAVIILGHSERLEVGRLWAEELDRRKLFETIDLITLNRAAAMAGRVSLRHHLKKSTVLTHSAGVTRVNEALQIIAINPPEPVEGVLELMRRAIKADEGPTEPEVGAHKTGNLDLLQAGLEMLRSPASTIDTIYKIGRGGYSTVKELSARQDDFPAGRAIVHADSDRFGFSDSADMMAAALAGITALTIGGGTYHNSILFTPGRILSEMTPTILQRS